MLIYVLKVHLITHTLKSFRAKKLMSGQINLICKHCNHIININAFDVVDTNFQDINMESERSSHNEKKVRERFVDNKILV